jgi:hypothetical protein
MHLVPRSQRPLTARPSRPAIRATHVGALTVPEMPTGLMGLIITIAVLAAGGTLGAMALVKHKVIGAALGSIAGLFGLGLFEKAHAATSPPLPPMPSTCPDGSLAPGGNTAACPPPKMGPNDPDSPPGGWQYNASVASPQTVQAAAAALAAVNPCLPSSEQLVRNFQAAAGLAQLNTSPGWNAVNPPGTDGRYGGDTAKAMAQYVPNPPAACYSNISTSRPAWWGPVGGYTNGASAGVPNA